MLTYGERFMRQQFGAAYFSRKVRILLKALELQVELIDIGNVAASDPTLFAEIRPSVSSPGGKYHTAD